jgi:hypothetical protein
MAKTMMKVMIVGARVDDQLVGVAETEEETADIGACHTHILGRAYSPVRTNRIPQLKAAI